MSSNIFNLFYLSYKKNPSKTCLSFPNKEFTYEDIFNASGKIARLIEKDKCSYIGLLANRSYSAYVGILAIIRCGKTYVPLNPKFPTRKINQILIAAEIQTIIVENESLIKISELAPSHKFSILAPELSPNENKGFGDNDIFDLETIANSQIDYCFSESSISKMYLLFTSGSTGEPKGIEISHQSVLDYLVYTQTRLQLNENDKCSQIFDLSFDLSIHDLFLTWMNGATLCIPEKRLFNPVQYVIKNNLTVWFSVPSVAYSLSNNNFLQPDLFPSIRISLFCGEPLIASFVEKWEAATPNSKIENIYGPTETTIGISSYLWKRNQVNKTKNGIVSIGKVFPTQNYIIADDENHPLGQDSSGELLLSGSQVISGYYKGELDLMDKFTQIDRSNPSLYYRTGDIVSQDSEGYIYFMHRKDFEFKIRGYRVHEEEINNAIRKITNISNIISIPYSGKSAGHEGIASFILSKENIDEKAIISACKSFLPDYMIPNKIIVIKELPLNINGKVDRKHLLTLLN